MTEGKEYLRASNSIIMKLKSRAEDLKNDNQVHYTKD
jgi:hypothetical protein